jgi:hypothetical protein
MINVRAVGAMIILSAAVAAPAFAKEHGHAHNRHRGAYNQMSVPYDAPANGVGLSSRAWNPTGQVNPGTSNAPCGNCGGGE